MTTGVFPTISPLAGTDSAVKCLLCPSLPGTYIQPKPRTGGYGADPASIARAVSEHYETVHPERARSMS